MAVEFAVILAEEWGLVSQDSSSLHLAFEHAAASDLPTAVLLSDASAAGLGVASVVVLVLDETSVAPWVGAVASLEPAAVGDVKAAGIVALQVEEGAG